MIVMLKVLGILHPIFHIFIILMLVVVPLLVKSLRNIYFPKRIKFHHHRVGGMIIFVTQVIQTKQKKVVVEGDGYGKRILTNLKINLIQTILLRRIEMTIVILMVILI